MKNVRGKRLLLLWWNNSNSVLTLISSSFSFHNRVIFGFVHVGFLSLHNECKMKEYVQSTDGINERREHGKC